MLTDEVRYKLLRLLETNPELSQRQVARSLGVSLGKTNYCLKALIQRGLVKATNFRNHENKILYTYYLTPRGIEEKARVTMRFLQRKLEEYQALQAEIEQIRSDVRANGARGDA
jgi:EPS-associated MarR family transcriptional regulator